jgi:hypothetical protein
MEQSIKKSFMDDFPYIICTYQVNLKKGLSNEKIWARAMRHSAEPSFKIEYLGEFVTEFEKCVGVLIWGLGVID